MGMALGRVVAVQVEVDGQVVALCTALGSQEVGLDQVVVVLNSNSGWFAVSPARWFAVTAPSDAVLVSDRGSVDPHYTNQGPS